MKIVSKKILVRKAKLSDIHSLCELEQACFTQDRFSIKHYRHLLQSASVLSWIIHYDRQPIGSAIVLFRKNSSLARLYSFAIHPEFQRLGMASRLYIHLEKSCRKLAASEIRLEVRKDNRKAIRFYRKLGFLSFGEHANYYEDGTDALRMRKVLG